MSSLSNLWGSALTGLYVICIGGYCCRSTLTSVVGGMTSYRCGILIPTRYVNYLFNIYKLSHFTHITCIYSSCSYQE